MPGAIHSNEKRAGAKCTTLSFDRVRDNFQGLEC